jgi:hypothetical protein
MRYCPTCRAEYAPGAERCHDCDVDLVDVLLDDTDPTPENLVTVAAFDTTVKASILASRLEAEGIECFLADAETIAAHGLLAPALGGVKIQVREPDAARAAAIIRQAVPAPARICPSCGSVDVRRKGLSCLMIIGLWMTLGLLALLFRPQWKCLRCAREWN